jgi:hypothetical protein
MSDEFASPASSTGIKWEPLKGSLLLIEPHSFEEEVKTDYGITSAVRADVHVLDGKNSGEEYLDTLIFPKVLQSQVRNRIGMKVLGRLEQGAAKPGQSPPWRIADSTDGEKAAARKWLNRQISDADEPPF